jgi:hypothetical protein
MDKPNDYVPTQHEVDAFIRVNAGLPILKPIVKTKAVNGQLLYVDGKNVTVVKYDAPFALLQHIKRTMINNGYNKKKFQIKNI